MSKVKVRWQASDGYVGGSRPQVAIIDVSDYVGLSRFEAENMFDSDMEAAFRDQVQWDCDDYEASLSEIIEAAAKLAVEDETASPEQEEQTG